MVQSEDCALWQASGAHWSRLKELKEFFKRCSHFWLISAIKNQQDN